MEFKQMKKLLQENFKKMSEDATHLFEVDVDKDEMWELYQDSFEPKYNKIFRERREHDCSCCRQFIRNIGNAVVIKDNKIQTIWDFETNDAEYQPPLNALSQYIESKAVSDVYITKFKKIGIDNNLEQLEDKTILKWEHFFLELPDKFVDKSNRSEGDIKGSLRDTRNVFKRSLDEITEDSLLTVLELILSNTLYKGSEWKTILTEFLKYKKEYSKLKTEIAKHNYTWTKSVSVGNVIGKIRNHSIGTLLVNISEGMDLDTAVKKYEVIVAPSNYKRPKAIFTKKMLEDAKNTVNELGYANSLSRRYATLDDINVNNILFSNKDSAKRIDGMGVFDDMSKEIAINPKKFSKVEEISISDFVENVIPTAKELEVFLENKHSSNMVSLIAPENKDSKSMFKWNNPFGWAYSGNITDSELKQQVASKGGRVDGVLRMSSSWNHNGKENQSLMDFHVFLPNSNQVTREKNGIEIHDNYGNNKRVGWNHRINNETGGSQDVDYVNPAPINYIPVENITFPDLTKLPEGIYTFKAHNWKFRGTGHGFKSEIEFGGQILEFDYNKVIKHKEWVTLAKIELKNGQWSVIESLNCKQPSKEIWNLTTNQFVPVSVAMFSPNYWDEQEGIGHRHYFFMMKNCVNPELPNGFYNEFLKQDLVTHKRVFEALASKMAVKDMDDQLSGIGFSSTKRSELLVKVKGQSERILKIKF